MRHLAREETLNQFNYRRNLYVSCKKPFVSALIATILVASSAAANTISINDLSPQQQRTLIRAAQTFAEYPDLVKVAFCESSLTHYDADGNVIRGQVDSRDTGLMQINTGYHLEDSRRLGFDIFTEAGNKAYALHLRRHQGLQPWSASEDCWENLTLPSIQMLASLS